MERFDCLCPDPSLSRLSPNEMDAMDSVREEIERFLVRLRVTRVALNLRPDFGRLTLLRIARSFPAWI